MNNRLALALIIGFLVSMITALMTAEVRYYDLGLGKKEIKEREYELSRYGKKETEYSSTFILVSLIGGVGIGYLLIGPEKKKY